MPCVLLLKLVRASCASSWFCRFALFFREMAKKRAEETTHRLAEEARAMGLRLAFENVGYHGQSIYTEAEYAGALDNVDSVVGYLIDIGHAHLNGWNIPQMIERLSHRLVGLHIHDNNGSSDQHRPIYDGSVPWEDIFQVMKKSCGSECECILEYAPGTPLDILILGKKILLENVA